MTFDYKKEHARESHEAKCSFFMMRLDYKKTLREKRPLWKEMCLFPVSSLHLARVSLSLVQKDEKKQPYSAFFSELGNEHSWEEINKNMILHASSLWWGIGHLRPQKVVFREQWVYHIHVSKNYQLLPDTWKSRVRLKQCIYQYHSLCFVGVFCFLEIHLKGCGGVVSVYCSNLGTIVTISNRTLWSICPR